MRAVFAGTGSEEKEFPSFSSAHRRRIAQQMKKAREKLASSCLNYVNKPLNFDKELIRLFAQTRMELAFITLLFPLVVGVIALFWTSPVFIMAWFLSITSLGSMEIWLCQTYLNTSAHTHSPINVPQWKYRFLVLEFSCAIAWGALSFLPYNIGHDVGYPLIPTFIILTLALVSTFNAITTAALPKAVYVTLFPPLLAILLFLYRSTDFTHLPIVQLILCAYLCFIMLTRRIYEASLSSLYFQKEREVLITELEQAKINSDEACRRAQEANLAKSRFLATMSHELRTPLNAILGFSEVMKNELFGPHEVKTYQGYSQDIHTSGQHLLKLINEILDLSRVEAGRYELHEESISLAHIMEDCCHLLKLRADKRHISIASSIEPHLPNLWVDERALRQIILNLLTNAIKFTPQGGKIYMKIGWTKARGQYLSIRDTGPGIPADEIPIIMSTFGRGSFAHKTAEEGTGLGLPIVKGLIELHDGTLTIRSHMKEGTEAIVIFPPGRVMETAIPPMTQIKPL